MQKIKQKTKQNKKNFRKDLTKKIMSKIDSGEIKMRPKIYFVAGSVITFTGLIFSIIASAFFINLTRFVIRSQSPMKQFRFEQMIYNFPWWIPVAALVLIILGIYLLKKYDFSYKKNFLVIVLSFIIAVFAAGWLMDFFGINLTLGRRGPMRRFYQKYRLSPYQYRYWR